MTNDSNEISKVETAKGSQVTNGDWDAKWVKEAKGCRQVQKELLRYLGGWGVGGVSIVG